MANRFQKFFESIVYAGMKPGARSPQGETAAKPGLLARFLNAPAPSDPLYLTNQTLGQKARRILLMASPLVLVIAVLLTIYAFSSKTTAAPKQLTVAEIHEKVLPGFNKEIRLDSNRNVEVTEVHFENTGGGVMVGSLRNTTDRTIIQAVVVFELADSAHSELGAVTVTETNLAPGASRTFKKPIEQTNAMYALVREMETR
jgi:hypothetical protein